MRHTLVYIGHAEEGITFLQRILEDSDTSLSGVICTTDVSQYQKIKSLLPDDIPLAMGTDYPLLTPRTKECKESFLTPARAWDLFNEVVSGRKEVVIVNIGSLTNLAISLMRHPELRENISRVVLLGGSAGSGDVTPFAERSIYEDPYSAKMIFELGIPIQMLGLEQRAYFSAVQKEELLYQLFKSPESFELKHCHVGVETISDKTRGMTVCDLYGKSEKEKNTELVMGRKGGAEA